MANDRKKLYAVAKSLILKQLLQKKEGLTNKERKKEEKIIT
jgi:hypothetical protein